MKPVTFSHADHTRNIDTVQEEIKKLEASRFRALVEADMPTLDALVANDVVHVHANGKIDDKAAYLEMARSQIHFLSATREQLMVRVYGDMAIATGPMRQSIEIVTTGQRIDMQMVTTQVWRKDGDTWRQVSFHATSL